MPRPALQSASGSRIKLGNTLSEDQLFEDKFDYQLSNPPFGVDWKRSMHAILYSRRHRASLDEEEVDQV